MIPKKIHYCWFGGNPLPKSAIKCIDSWKKFFPDYEIIEWNESNFDVNMMIFTKEAYSAKKYAYVSDVARFYILYHEGGLYFDTDVEVINGMDDILERGAFMGIEVQADEGTTSPMVNPGLGIGAAAKLPLYAAILQHYQEAHFVDENGDQISGTVVAHTTDVLKQKGLKPTNAIQQVEGIWIYPMDYFNPLDDATGVLRKTKNTRSIHWYSKTWVDKPMWYFRVTRILHRLFGVNALERFKK